MVLTILGLETIADLKGINVPTDTIYQLLGPNFPTVESFRAYYYKASSALTPDDDQVVCPDSVNPATQSGRWLACDFQYLNADWNATSGAPLILNKPAIPDPQVPADWDAVSGPSRILNKPSIPPAFSIGAPSSRSLSLATAYQAANPSKDTLITVNLQSTSSVSLAGAVNNEGGVWIGATSAVASGTGTEVGVHKNNFGGTLVLGLNLSQTVAQTVSFILPAGWYFAVRQTLGTGLNVVSAYDQPIN